MTPYEVIYIKDKIDKSVINEIINTPELGVDTETSGLDPHVNWVRLLQISTLNKVFIFDFKHLPQEEKNKLKGIFKFTKTAILQSAAFDIKFLWKQGIDITDATWIFDTMIASQLIYNGLPIKHTLKDISERELGETIDKSEQTSDWTTDELSQEQIDYAALDPFQLHALKNKLNALIEQNGLTDVACIEFRAIPVIAALEYNGIYIDLDLWESTIPEINAKLVDLEKQLLSTMPEVYIQETFSGEVLCNLNTSSNQQMLSRLQALGVPDPNDETKPIASTGKDVLKLLSPADYPIIDILIENRKNLKLLNTFILPMRGYMNPNTKRIHPRYFQLAAYTGRIACTEPAILQMPRGKDFRRCVTIQNNEHQLFDIDYSQIEMRVAAYLAEEDALKIIFNDDEDVYIRTAARINSMSLEEFSSKDPAWMKSERQKAKSACLGLIYGMSAKKFRDYAKSVFGLVFSMKEAKELRDMFFRLYPNLVTWHTKCTNNLGRRTKLINKTGRTSLCEVTYTNVINFGDQSLSTDIMKESLARIFFYLKQEYGVVPLFDRCPIWQTIYLHDEAQYEGLPEELKKQSSVIESIMKDTAEEFLDHLVTIKAEGAFGMNWAECH